MPAKVAELAVTAVLEASIEVAVDELVVAPLQSEPSEMVVRTCSHLPRGRSERASESSRSSDSRPPSCPHGVARSIEEHPGVGGDVTLAQLLGELCSGRTHAEHLVVVIENHRDLGELGVSKGQFASGRDGLEQLHRLPPHRAPVGRPTDRPEEPRERDEAFSLTPNVLELPVGLERPRRRGDRVAEVVGEVALVESLSQQVRLRLRAGARRRIEARVRTALQPRDVRRLPQRARPPRARTRSTAVAVGAGISMVRKSGEIEDSGRRRSERCESIPVQ